MDERYRKYKTIEIAFKARARGDRELLCMFWGRWRELMRVWHYMISVRHDVKRRTALLDQVREHYLKDVYSVKLALTQARNNKNAANSIFASTVDPTPTLDLRTWGEPPKRHKSKFDELETLGYLRLAGVGEEAERKREGYELLEESTIPCYAPKECAFLSHHCEECQGVLALVYARNERVSAALGLVTNWEKFVLETKDDLSKIPDLEKQAKLLREQLVNTGSQLSTSELRVSELEDALAALQKQYAEEQVNHQKKLESVEKVASRVPGLEDQVKHLTGTVHELESVQVEKMGAIKESRDKIASLEELVKSSKAELESKLASRETALARAKQGLIEAHDRINMGQEELRQSRSEAIPQLKAQLAELERQVGFGEQIQSSLSSELTQTKEYLESAEDRADRLEMELTSCREELVNALTPPQVRDCEVQASPATCESGMGFQWSQHKEPNGIFNILHVSRAVEAFSDAPDEIVAKQWVTDMGSDMGCQATPIMTDSSTHCVLKTDQEIRLESELEETLDKLESTEESLEKTKRLLHSTQIELNMANQEVEDIGMERDDALELVETIEKSTTDKLNSSWSAKYRLQIIVSRMALNTQQSLTNKLAGMLNGMKVKIKGQTHFLGKLTSGTTSLASKAHKAHKHHKEKQDDHDGGDETQKSSENHPMFNAQAIAALSKSPVSKSNQQTSFSTAPSLAQQQQQQQVEQQAPVYQQQHTVQQAPLQQQQQVEQQAPVYQQQQTVQQAPLQQQQQVEQQAPVYQQQQTVQQDAQQQQQQVEQQAPPVQQQQQSASPTSHNSSSSGDDVDILKAQLHALKRENHNLKAKGKEDFVRPNSYAPSYAVPSQPVLQSQPVYVDPLPVVQAPVQAPPPTNVQSIDQQPVAEQLSTTEQPLPYADGSPPSSPKQQHPPTSSERPVDIEPVDDEVTSTTLAPERRIETEESSSEKSSFSFKPPANDYSDSRQETVDDTMYSSDRSENNTMFSDDDTDDDLELMGGKGDSTAFDHDAAAMEDFVAVMDKKIEDLVATTKEADAKVAQIRFVLAVKSKESQTKSKQIAKIKSSLAVLSAQLAEERESREKIQSQMSKVGDEAGQIRADLKKRTAERDTARTLCEERLGLIEATEKREQALKMELDSLKSSYDGLANQRLEELAQLNNNLESASMKIEELKKERDLLIGDKELLTSAVNDAYRTHCSEVKRVFLDNLKQTRSVGTQLDCCVCAMRPTDNTAVSSLANQKAGSPGFGSLASNSISSNDQGYGYSGYPIPTNDMSSNNSSTRKDKSRARGSFRGNGTRNNGFGTTTGLPGSKSTSDSKKVSIVVDRTGQRYPFNIGGSYRSVSASNGPNVRSMDSDSMGLLLPRTTPIGAALSSGKLVPSSSDLRSTPHAFDSMKAAPLPWAPLLPTDRAKLGLSDETYSREGSGLMNNYLMGSSQNQNSTYQDGLYNDEDMRDPHDQTWKSESREFRDEGNDNERLLDDALSNHLENERRRANKARLGQESNSRGSLNLKALSPIHGMTSSFPLNKNENENDADLSFVPTMSHFAPPAPPKQKSNFGQQTDTA